MVEDRGFEPLYSPNHKDPNQDQNRANDAPKQAKTSEFIRGHETQGGQSRTLEGHHNTTSEAQPEHNQSRTTPAFPADAPAVPPETAASHGIDRDVLALAQKLAALSPEARAALKALLE